MSWYFWCLLFLLILTDCLSALSALQSVNWKSPRVILWLHNKIKRAVDHILDISLYWIPGHRGIPLNEKADCLAKRVTNSGALLDWLSSKDMARSFKLSTKRQSEQLYHRSSKYFHSHGDIPSIKQSHSWALNRLEDSFFPRLLCKMLITSAVLESFNLSE